MRRVTEEQKQKSRERREKVRAFAAHIAQLTPAHREQLAAKAGGVVTIEGRRLSFGNQMMIALQLENATVVGGFAQWIKAGRAVSKGQSAGAYIWVPLGPKDDNGNIDMSDEKKFMLAPVFDISQTVELEGKEGAAHRMASEVRRGGGHVQQPTKEHSDSEFEPLAA